MFWFGVVSGRGSAKFGGGKGRLGE